KRELGAGTNRSAGPGGSRNHNSNDGSGCKRQCNRRASRGTGLRRRAKHTGPKPSPEGRPARGKQSMKRRETLAVEQLEAREVPSTFGVPWPDAQHLKLSFVPDGTMVDGAPSVLFQSLNATAPTSAWQQEILRAVKTWTSATNINIGLVADDGEPL